MGTVFLVMLLTLAALIYGLGAAAVLVVLIAPIALAIAAWDDYRWEHPRKPPKKNKHGLPWWWSI